ncbi:hypothetical protein [Terracidiphilus gabretensis]|uniref:hypothetical protein n=1 Tax=Terracidiphilus gabretensis TaxID=1577687 RepID=UPI0012FBF708|nr:hypothetical protein [Terracidiphilus gabretensis]
MSYNVEPCTHPYRNPALKSCCEARNLALFLATEEEVDRLLKNPYHHGHSREEIAKAATQQTIFAAGSNAFLAQLPELDSRQNVRDYAACIAHAMALDVIDPNHGPKLLYAAQVILSSYRAEAKAVAQDPARATEAAA